MNIIKPRVAEKRAHDGICGMEFPAVNYTVALLYKMFGFSDFWYRFLVFILSTIGVIYAFKITEYFIKKYWLSILIVLVWFCSPILLYYSIGFLPDTVALTFAFMACYYIILWIKEELNKVGILFFSIAMAGLIKVTFLIFPLGMFVALVGLNWKKYFVEIKNRKLGILFFVSILPVLSWYIYSAQLTRQTTNTHFLQKINPPESISEFFSNSRAIFINWESQIYAKYMVSIILLIGLILSCIQYKKYKDLARIYLWFLASVAAVFVLFNRQFLHHDYYLHIVYPLLLIGLVFLVKYLQDVTAKKSFWLKQLVWIVPVLMFFYSFFYTNKMLFYRFSPGNYFYQEVFQGIDDYTKYANKWNQLIPQREQVVSVFDPQPNATLYLMKRSGIRIANDFSPELTRAILEKSPKIQYFVINDTSKWFQNYQKAMPFQLEKMGKVGGIFVYRKRNGSILIF